VLANFDPLLPRWPCSLVSPLRAPPAVWGHSVRGRPAPRLAFSNRNERPRRLLAAARARPGLPRVRRALPLRRHTGPLDPESKRAPLPGERPWLGDRHRLRCPLPYHRGGWPRSAGCCLWPRPWERSRAQCPSSSAFRPRTGRGAEFPRPLRTSRSWRDSKAKALELRRHLRCPRADSEPGRAARLETAPRSSPGRHRAPPGVLRSSCQGRRHERARQAAASAASGGESRRHADRKQHVRANLARCQRSGGLTLSTHCAFPVTTRCAPTCAGVPRRPRA
jgi:hypothetical protein